VYLSISQGQRQKPSKKKGHAVQSERETTVKARWSKAGRTITGRPDLLSETGKRPGKAAWMNVGEKTNSLPD